MRGVQEQRQLFARISVCVDVCVFINGTLFVRPSERAGQAVLFISSDIMAGKEIAVVRL